MDEEEFGGAWELIKEGFMTSFALFLVSITLVTASSECMYVELHCLVAELSPPDQGVLDTLPFSYYLLL